MKIKTINSNSYTNYLNRIHYNSEEADPEIVSKLLLKIKTLITNPFFLPHAVFAVDYTKGKYLFWDNNDNLGGYKPSYILNEGTDIIPKLVEKRNFKTINDKIFPLTIEKLQEYGNDIFVSFNFKVRKSDGTWMELFQKGIYVTCPKTGLPLACIGINMDITRFKNDSFIYYTVERHDSIHNKVDIIHKNQFNVLIEELKLTPREILLIRCLSDGFSSKLIADKLKISINTVNNHRQNILRKTNCSNVAELISFSIQAGVK